MIELLPIVFALVPELIRRERLKVFRGFENEVVTPSKEELYTHRANYPDIYQWIMGNYEHLINAIHKSKASNKLESIRNILISVQVTVRMFEASEVSKVCWLSKLGH